MRNILTISFGIMLSVAILSFGIFVPNHFSNMFLSRQYEYETSLEKLYEKKAPSRDIKLLKENFEKYQISLWGLVHRFIDLKSLAIVLGGAFASSLIAYKGLIAFGGLKQFFKIFYRDVKNQDYEETYYRLLDFIHLRIDGEPISDEAIDQIKDEYFRTWMFDFIAVDLVSEDVMREIIHSEIEKYSYSQYRELDILEHYVKSLPAFGMIGTVIGLILMLGDAANNTASLIDLMGSMSVALITTLYGVVFSYSLFAPALTKRKLRIDAKIHLMEMTGKGIFDLYAGENPEIMKKNLIGYLPPSIKSKIIRESSQMGAGDLGL